MSWARRYHKCQSCGTTKKKHVASGLCETCYSRLSEKKRRGHITRRVGQPLSKQINKDDLKSLYASGLSLLDIARQYNCTRAYIHKRMKQYGVPRRDHAGGVSEAQRLAISSQGTRRVYSMNEQFFSSWNPVMAYVSGVICSDGCLSNEGYSFSISQKDIELLVKVRALMSSTDSIRFSPKRGIAGAIHTLRISNVKVYKDLIRIGLTPKKSLTVHFPAMPSDCVRHFIRGCWDGDGSISFAGNNLLTPRASYVSGSKVFIAAMVNHLAALGLSVATIHEDKRCGASYIKYGPTDCKKLFHILYDDVDESAFLLRKHDKFKAFADIYLANLDRFRGRKYCRRRRPIRRSGSLSKEIRAATDALKKEMKLS